MKTEHSEPRSRILSIIKNPLDFFTIALLILEGLMISAFFNLEQNYKIWAFAGSLIIFILIVMIVAKITLSRPENRSIESNSISLLRLEYKNQNEQLKIDNSSRAAGINQKQKF